MTITNSFFFSIIMSLSTIYFILLRYIYINNFREYKFVQWRRFHVASYSLPIKVVLFSAPPNSLTRHQACTRHKAPGTKHQACTRHKALSTRHHAGTRHCLHIWADKDADTGRNIYGLLYSILYCILQLKLIATQASVRWGTHCSECSL